MNITNQELVGKIDHAVLAATATEEDIKKMCNQAKEFGFAAVFPNGRWVELCADLLHDTKVKVGGVVSFPLGANSTKMKVQQAEQLMKIGADEIDIVADIAAIIEGDKKFLHKQFNAILEVCHSMRPAVTLKAIIEATALTTEQKIFVCQIADSCRVDYVKTSTGMHSTGGATVEDIKLIKEHAPGCKVKASGGIRTLRQAIAMLEAGADRLGTSSGANILEELKAELSK